MTEMIQLIEQIGASIRPDDITGQERTELARDQVDERLIGRLVGE